MSEPTEPTEPTGPTTPTVPSPAHDNTNGESPVADLTGNPIPEGEAL